MADRPEISFSGFSGETEAFLWGIALNNERPWFRAHRQEYLEHLYEPLTALARIVGERMEQTHQLGVEPHTTRIYRDARRLHGRGPYKENMWFTLRGSWEDWTSAPAFYFEIRRDGCEYGMGWYCMKTEEREKFRRRADAAPAELEALLGEFYQQNVFAVGGEEYKRGKPCSSELIRPLYNRKEILFYRELKWGRELMAKNLPDKLVRHFSLLVPLYRYFLRLSLEQEPQ